MSQKIRANKALRDLMKQAAHVPVWKPTAAEKAANWACAGYGTTNVSAVIDGKQVTLKGRMVTRNTIDGHAPCFTFSAFIDGIRVNRTQLIKAFSEPA